MKQVRAFLFEHLINLDGQETDFRVGVRAAAPLKEMAPGACIGDHKDFGLASIRKNGTRRLARPLAPVAGRDFRVLLLDIFSRSAGKFGVSLANALDSLLPLGPQC